MIFDGLGVLNTFSTCDIFNLTMGLSGCDTTLSSGASVFKYICVTFRN